MVVCRRGKRTEGLDGSPAATLGASFRVFATTDSASLSTEVAFHRQLVVQPDDPDSLQIQAQAKQSRKGNGNKPELWHLKGFRGRARACGNFSASLLHVVDGLYADSRCQFVSKSKKIHGPMRWTSTLIHTHKICSCGRRFHAEILSECSEHAGFRSRGGRWAWAMRDLQLKTLDRFSHRGGNRP